MLNCLLPCLPTQTQRMLYLLQHQCLVLTSPWLDSSVKHSNNQATKYPSDSSQFSHSHCIFTEAWSLIKPNRKFGCSALCYLWLRKALEALKLIWHMEELVKPLINHAVTRMNNLHTICCQQDTWEFPHFCANTGHIRTNFGHSVFVEIRPTFQSWHCWLSVDLQIWYDNSTERFAYLSKCSSIEDVLVSPEKASTFLKQGSSHNTH